MFSNLLSRYLIGLWFLHSSEPLRITSLDVPKNAWERVKLNCRYNLNDNETLYAVKWYKDGKEFFRCHADGSTAVFTNKELAIYPPQKVYVGSCFFELVPYTVESGGTYTCEVGLDQPTFQTQSEEASLQIIEPLKRTQHGISTEKIDDGKLTVNVSEGKGENGSSGFRFTYFMPICLILICSFVIICY